MLRNNELPERILPGTSQSSSEGAIREDRLVDPPCMVVRSSSINGQGLFSTKLNRTGEVLMVIDGEVIDSNEARRRETEEGNCDVVGRRWTSLTVTRSSAFRALRRIAADAGAPLALRNIGAQASAE